MIQAEPAADAWKVITETRETVRPSPDPTVRSAPASWSNITPEGVIAPETLLSDVTPTCSAAFPPS